jgi:hypothetical protein
MTPQTDLFIKKSKKEQIYEFIKQRGRCRTSDIIKFGLAIYTNRGDRYARDLAEEIPPRIWRLREDLKHIFYPNCREEVWSCYEADKTPEGIYANV